MIVRNLFGAVLGVFLLFGMKPAAAQEAPLTIFAAASLKEALDTLNGVWTAKGKPPLRLVYAASGALARQIEQGAPADVFISADDAWMDYVATRGGIKPESRRIVAGNRLVVIAASHSARLVTIAPGMRAEPLHVGGKIAVGDAKAVPAGAYAKAALERLGLWEAMQPHLVMVENVRVALALVARGEADTGIVYASDAVSEPRVRVIGSFPNTLHPPIRYPAALVAASKHPDAAGLLDFLASPEARAVLTRFDFLVEG